MAKKTSADKAAQAVWDKQRDERMAIPQNMITPNEPWYQLLLDVARQHMPTEDLGRVQEVVDELLTKQHARVVKDPNHPGGTRVEGYTADVHMAVAKAIVDKCAPETCDNCKAETITYPWRNKQNWCKDCTKRVLDAERAAIERGEEPRDDEPPPKPAMEQVVEKGKALAQALDNIANEFVNHDPIDDGIEICLGCGNAEELCVCDSELADDPKDPTEADNPQQTEESNTVPSASAQDAGNAAESPNANAVDVCDLCDGAFGPPQFELPNGDLVCQQCWDESAETSLAVESDLKARSHEPEVLDDDCDEEHTPGVPCLACSWTGGVAAQVNQTTTLEDVYKMRCKVMESTGELVPIDDCFAVAGMEPPRVVDETGALMPFNIHDDATGEWFVGLVRHIQNCISEAGNQYALMVGQMLGALRGLDYKYGLQLAQWASTKMEYTKTGKLRRRFHRTMRGAVFFQRTGGAKIVDHKAVSRFIYELPKDKLEFFGVKEVRQMNKDRLLKLFSEGYAIPGIEEEPFHDLGVAVVGSDKAYSFNAEKLRITKKIKELQLKTMGELTAGEEDEHDGDD